MGLDIFVAPTTVSCMLCRGVVSVRKGHKERFKNHLSQDHEVHFDMELLFAMSGLNMEEKKEIISFIENGGKLDPDQNTLDESESTQLLEERTVKNKEKDNQQQPTSM